jgi:predicted acetyltransferase
MIRPYRPTDKDNCIRILLEVGWMEGKKTDSEVFDSYISDSTAFVTELHGDAEVLVITRPGQVIVQDKDVNMSVVTGVLTSRVARMQGHALKTTALAITHSAENGAAVSFLGIFDQGYYDKLGFGTLGYTRVTTIDPAKLKVPKLTRAPKRYTKKDSEAIHNCRRNRKRIHGGCNLDGVGTTGCELVWSENGFVLGFENEEGELTHFLWLNSKGIHGPYHCSCYCWQTPEQLVELFSVLQSLSDQVYSVSLFEPTGFQLQDFLDRPFATNRSRKNGDHDSNTRCDAWMQCRILDVSTCIGALKLCGNPVSFNMVVTDPIEQYIPSDSSWKGVAGEWTVQLGEKSSANLGTDESLPTLTCSINDLSRLWIGASTAEALATVGDLSADNKLIASIDSILNIPAPTVDWDF